MKCLWITLADPDPATNGQLIYSKGLIEATQRAGASLTVIGLARDEQQRPMVDSRGIEWRLATEQRDPSWRRLLSRDPAIAQRTSPAMKQLLEHSLAERQWDAVVFDSICAGWALRRVVQHRANCARPPRIVFLAHNHEVTVARRIAAEARGLRRPVKKIDLLKVIDLERRLIAAADVMAANGPEDRQRFATESGRPFELLMPGYNGIRVSKRVIDAATPRRAILVGSLDFPPKRVAVESFLEVAATRLSNAGIDLQIVGEVQADYLAQMRQRFPTVDFVGPVADVEPYFMSARLALVPDIIGGFKLKGLDYVFHRLPILSMRIALPGMPLGDGHSVGFFDSHSAMTEGVVSLIDDFPRLNERQERAYAACADCFDWDRIGQQVAKICAGDKAFKVVKGGLAPERAARPARVAAGR